MRGRFFQQTGWLLCLSVIGVIWSSGCKPSSSIENEIEAKKEKQIDPRFEEVADAGTVLYLDQGDSWEVSLPREEFYKQGSRGILTREFVRQAFLIAAREELGLLVRDELLGDPMPTESNPARMTMGIVLRDGERELRVARANSRRFSPAPRFYSLGPNGLVNDRVYEQTEALSRGEFVRILSEFGFHGKPTPHNPKAKVPEAVKPLLEKMTFPCQFAAIRLLHQTIRQQGESDALLGALVRGYANLAWLTDYFWLPGKKSIQARTVLYAQRLMSRGKNLRWARQHRAYALAACGLHTAALADLEAADTPKDVYKPIATDAAWKTIRSLQEPPSFEEEPIWFSRNDEAGPESSQVTPGSGTKDPPWVDCIRGLCHWNLDLLDSEKVDPSCKELAELLNLVALEFSDGLSWRARSPKASRRVSKRMPECYRAWSTAMFRVPVGLGRQRTVEILNHLPRELYTRLAMLPDLPEAIRQMCQEQSGEETKKCLSLDRLWGYSGGFDHDEFQVRQNLVERLTKEPDQADLSWATLGYLIHEISFAQAWWRIHFYANILCTEPDEIIEEIYPLVENHPLRPLVDIWSSDSTRAAQASREVDRLSFAGLDLKLSLCFHRFSAAQQQKARAVLLPNTDMVARDLIKAISTYRRNTTYESHLLRTKALLSVSSDCPCGLGLYATQHWEQVKSKEEVLVRKKGKFIKVLEGIAYGYWYSDDYEKSIPYFEKAIEISPETGLYQSLAKIYWNQGNRDKWRKTLLKRLKKESLGLENARVCQKIALDYMNHFEFKEALPYAEQAADCYSGGGLRCAARCHEGLRDFDKAEKYYKATSERYGGYDWYLYCHRTGSPNVDKARPFAEEKVKLALEQQSKDQLGCVGIYYILEGKPEKVIPVYEKMYEMTEKNPYYALHAALTADEAEKEKVRDRLLNRIVEDHESSDNELNQGYAKLAQWILSDLESEGKGKSSLEAIDEYLDSACSDHRSNLPYFVGKYLQLHGNTEKASKYFRRSLATIQVDYWNRTLAGAALVSLREPSDCYLCVLDKERENEKRWKQKNLEKIKKAREDKMKKEVKATEKKEGSAESAT